MGNWVTEALSGVDRCVGKGINILTVTSFSDLRSINSLGALTPGDYILKGSGNEDSACFRYLSKEVGVRRIELLCSLSLLPYASADEGARANSPRISCSPDAEDCTVFLKTDQTYPIPNVRAEMPGHHADFLRAAACPPFLKAAFMLAAEANNTQWGPYITTAGGPLNAYGMHGAGASDLCPPSLEQPKGTRQPPWEAVTRLNCNQSIPYGQDVDNTFDKAPRSSGVVPAIRDSTIQEGETEDGIFFSRGYGE